jgi:predicted transcriptional regulator
MIPIYIYCTKAKPYLTVGIEVGSFILSEDNPESHLAPKLNGRIVARCESKEAFCFYNGKGKDLFAIHLENVKPLSHSMPISDFYSNIVCTKPLNRAPESFQRCYREIPTPNGPCGYEVEECYLFSIRSPYVCKILNGEKDLEIRKTAPKELERKWK